jgi:hypothetical protein
VFCTECGTQSSVDAKFCENCGTAIGQSVPASSVQPLESGTTLEAPAPSRIPKWPLLVGVAIAMALVIGGVAVATSKAGNKSSSDGASSGETATAPTDKTILNVSGTGTRWIAAPPISESATVEYSWDCTNIGASAPINIDNTVYTSGFLANQGFSGTGTGQFSAINKTTAFLVSTPCAWTLKLIASGSATVGAFDPNACVAFCDGATPTPTPTADLTECSTPPVGNGDFNSLVIPQEAFARWSGGDTGRVIGCQTSGPLAKSTLPKSLPSQARCGGSPWILKLFNSGYADFNGDGVVDLAGFYRCFDPDAERGNVLDGPVRVLDGASPNPKKPNVLGTLDLSFDAKGGAYSPIVQSILADGGNTYVFLRYWDVNARGNADANCCPSGRRVLLYRFAGGKFSLAAERNLSAESEKYYEGG